MTGSREQVIASWTAYWRTGSGASCFNSDAELGLTGLWDEFIDELPEGARLLDLATGNGTVARRCAARARVRRIVLHIEAVDAAEIDPPSYTADPDKLFGDIRFRGKTSLEALPFPDAAFDGEVSQFGFEYADEAQAAAEVARTLAPGGRLRLIVHAQDGAVSRDIGTRVERLRSVLDGDGPVALVLALARAAETGDNKTVAQKSRKLPIASEHVRGLARHPPPDDAALFYSSAILQLWARRDRYWPADLRRSVEDGWNNAMGVAVRQEQMLRAARSAEDMKRLGARFAAAGVETEPVRAVRDERRGVRIAWLMDARKASDSRQ